MPLRLEFLQTVAPLGLAALSSPVVQGLLLEQRLHRWDQDQGFALQLGDSVEYPPCSTPIVDIPQVSSPSLQFQ